MLYFSMTYTLYESGPLDQYECSRMKYTEKKKKANEIIVESTQRYQTLSVL